MTLSESTSSLMAWFDLLAASQFLLTPTPTNISVNCIDYIKNSLVYKANNKMHLLNLNCQISDDFLSLLFRYSSSMKTLSNKFMHLTNYSVNKKNSEYQTNSDDKACQGHKW